MQDLIAFLGEHGDMAATLTAMQAYRDRWGVTPA
jgi:hypothetical protein